MGASYVILIPWKQCYLIVPIVSKRTEHISAGALEIMLASYVAWSLESSANHSCHPFQYEESSTPWSSPNYHHTDQYLTVNIDVSACMVSISYLMQICRYADMHQFPRIKSDTHKVELPTYLGSIVVQVCAWSHRSIFRQSDKLNHGSILYTVRNIVSLLFPPWGSQPWIHETDKHTLHRLYFPGNL